MEVILSHRQMPVRPQLSPQPAGAVIVQRAPIITHENQRQLHPAVEPCQHFACDKRSPRLDGDAFAAR